MTIPKSLHTVSVLVNVARELMRPVPYPPNNAVCNALHVLGYGDTPDAYGLAAKAVAILEKETAKQ